MKRTEVAVNGPYDFDLALRRAAFDPLKSIDLKKRLFKVPFWVEGEPVVVDVQATGTTEKPVFSISTTDAVDIKEIEPEVHKIFRWDQSLEQINSHFSETELSPLFQEYRGLPHIRDFSVYHSLVTCIIHQQLNLSFSYTLTKRFVEKYGMKYEGVWFHPMPEKTAKIPYEDLQELQFSRRKAEYLVDTSKLIAEGALDLNALEEMDDEKVLTKLIKIRGIGPWSAQSILLFGMGRENLMPAADVGIQNGLKNLRKQDVKPTPADLIDASKTWSPYNSYAALYLWESLGNHRAESSLPL